jgi:hypothetical protein
LISSLPSLREVLVPGKFSESVWKVSRQLPPVGWRGEGECPPQARPAGLWFRSDKGENRFLPFDLDKLPTQEQVEDLTADQIAELSRRATPQK